MSSSNGNPPSAQVRGTIHGRSVVLTVQEADVLIGTKRYRLLREGVQSLGGDLENLAPPEGADRDLFDLRVFTYTNLVAATVRAEGLEWPPSFEEFCRFPDSFYREWQTQVARLNPHWYPVAEEPADGPKAATVTSSE